MLRLTFHDSQPVQQSFRDAVIEGLSRAQKAIPAKFLYDETGSRLFEQICLQPEYYPPRVECQLLSQLAGELPALIGTGCVLIEPGVGSAAKVRLILDALRPSAFVPMDISSDYLKKVALELTREYAWLSVHAVHTDFTHSLPVPEVVPKGRRLLFFPGSTLGNFERHEAVQFLQRVHETVGDGGFLLIGVDTKKDAGILHVAYNDAAGVTARFNANLLYRMQRELDAELNPMGFNHQAFYNPLAGRVEMHLISAGRQQLLVNGYEFSLLNGESLHTENSYKYAPDEFLHLANECGFSLLRQWVDSEGLFANYLFTVV